MNEVREAAGSVSCDQVEPFEMSCRETLRRATRRPHERLHLHDGFASVKDGTITLRNYRALLVRLYGFYLPFERAIGADVSRTQWLERDLAWLGDNPETMSRVRLCPDLPLYDSRERRLGALYVVEGSALGGRQLWRGLDRLLGREAIDGRRFFAGRGDGVAAAWRDFLARLESPGHDLHGPDLRAPDLMGRAAVVSAAVETFEVFETWLSGWSDIG